MFAVSPPILYQAIFNNFIVKGGLRRAFLQCFQTKSIFGLKNFKQILDSPAMAFAIEADRTQSSDADCYASLSRAFTNNEKRLVIFSLFSDWVEKLERDVPQQFLSTIHILGEAQRKKRTR